MTTSFLNPRFQYCVRTSASGCFGVLVLVGMFPSILIAQGNNLLNNGAFEWRGDRLPGWEIAVGAGQPGKQSVVEAADGGSLRLSGDASTRQWMFVGQQLEVKGGDTYRLSFRARAEALQLQRNQFDNCYVGAFFLRGNQTLGNDVLPITRPEWSPEEMVIHVPDNVDGMRVMAFLSKTGALQVAEMRLEKLSAADSFDVLVQHMDRYYSYFELKNIDWPALTEKYRSRAEAARRPQEFESVILEMFAEMHDMHVWVERQNKPVSNYRSEWTPNFDFDFVAKKLVKSSPLGRFGWWGRTQTGVGYLRIDSLQMAERDQRLLENVLTQVLKSQAVIIDIRANRGGAEPMAQAIAGRFTEKPLIYAKQRFRSNEHHDAFYEVERGALQPAGDKPFAGKVCCLIGPGTVSSGEGMALMFAAMPNVIMVGQPTRGASGNPQPLVLPNGVVVRFSRWVAMDGEGNVIEDRGVQPDIVVEHGKGDPAFEKALKIVEQ